MKLTDEYGNIIKTTYSFKHGGEGDVYDIEGNPDLVVKIYNTEKRNNKKEYKQLINKIRIMCDMCDDELISKAGWPQRIVYQRNQPVGFTMNKIRYCNTLHQLTNTMDRRERFKDNNYKFLVLVAYNLACAVSVLHKKNIVIGDINESNFLIGNRTSAEKDGVYDFANNAIVHYIDCDSFQIMTSSEKFLCSVMKPHYFPPELVGSNLHTTIRTKNHDNFGLAVLIYYLLMLQKHPYEGIGVPGNITESIIGGNYVYGKNAKTKGIKPAQPEIYSTIFYSLNEEIRLLFEKAFDNTPGAIRPSANEWSEALYRQVQNLSRCEENENHYYNNSGECIWCKIKAQCKNYDPWENSDDIDSASYPQIPYNYTQDPDTSTSQNYSQNTSVNSPDTSTSQNYSQNTSVNSPDTSINQNYSQNTSVNSPDNTGNSSNDDFFIKIFVAVFFIPTCLFMFIKYLLGQMFKHKIFSTILIIIICLCQWAFWEPGGESVVKIMNYQVSAEKSNKDILKELIAEENTVKTYLTENHAQHNKDVLFLKFYENLTNAAEVYKPVKNEKYDYFINNKVKYKNNINHLLINNPKTKLYTLYKDSDTSNFMPVINVEYLEKEYGKYLSEPAHEFLKLKRLFQNDFDGYLYKDIIKMSDKAYLLNKFINKNEEFLRKYPDFMIKGTIKNDLKALKNKTLPDRNDDLLKENNLTLISDTADEGKREEISGGNENQTTYPKEDTNVSQYDDNIRFEINTDNADNEAAKEVTNTPGIRDRVYNPNETAEPAGSKVSNRGSTDNPTNPNEWIPYMRDFERRIKMNWNPPKGNKSNRTVVLIRISKDGRLLAHKIVKSSNSESFDKAGIRAVEIAAPFSPLPDFFTENHVDIEFTFDYNILNRQNGEKQN